MASGYFPLDPKSDEPGRKILQALNLLNEALDDLRSYPYGELTAEDANYDGQYLADLESGTRLIATCLSGHVNWQRLANEAIRVINGYLPPDSGVTEHDALNKLIEIFDGPLYRAANSCLPLGYEPGATK